MPATDVRHDLLAAIRLTRSPLAGGIRLGAGSGFDPRTAEQIAAELSVLLYTHWFTRSGQPRPNATLVEPPILVASLRSAHAATGRFGEGWRVVAVGEWGEITVERSGELIAVVPPDYVNLVHWAVPLRVGDPAAVTERRDFIDLQNGWWSTDGAAGAAPTAPMIRLYWNCPPQAAALLVGGVTTVLERLGLAFSLKCPVEASLFGRDDAVVLYLAPEAFELSKGELRTVYESLVPWLEDRVPPLTFRLGRGVGLAQDPADGQSYGQSRCLAVAASLVGADLAGVSDESDLVAAIVEQFPSHGVSATQPYLGVDASPDLVAPW